MGMDRDRGQDSMSVKTFTFCDICNPHSQIATDRREQPRDEGQGRRGDDDCSWFEGFPEDSAEEGWIVTSKGKHVCPRCYLHHKEAVFSI